MSAPAAAMNSVKPLLEDNEALARCAALARLGGCQRGGNPGLSGGGGRGAAIPKDESKVQPA